MSDTQTQGPFNYLVQYSFEYPKSDLRPDDQRWGVGTIPIQTDEEPKTEEQFLEIARHIGRLGKYEKVAINKIDPTDRFVDDTATVLEGLIVND